MLSHKMLRIIAYGESKYYRGHNDGLLSGLLIGFSMGYFMKKISS
jgi:hypothetical protein